MRLAVLEADIAALDCAAVFRAVGDLKARVIGMEIPCRAQKFDAVGVLIGGDHKARLSDSLGAPVALVSPTPDQNTPQRDKEGA